MTLQNNKGLLPILQKLGCYFLSLARIVELETGYEFSPDEINEVWIKSTREKYIVKDLIKNPDRILKTFCYYTTKPYLTIAQIGEEKNDKVIYWNWTKPLYQNANYLIEMVLTNGEYGTHFRLCDINKDVIYDPYSFKEYTSYPSGRYLHMMIIK